MTSNSEFAVYRKFSDVKQAEELAETLKNNNVDCKLVDNSPAIDITFTGNTLQNEVQLLVKQSDFEIANDLLDKKAEEQIEEVDDDHYLFDFENEELYDILIKPDEWSAFDYKLAQKILSERGQPVNEGLIRSLKKQRLDELAKPEGGQTSWILVGYLFAFFGGVIGLLIGWLLWKRKKSLPDGRKVFAYNDKDRNHGKIIFVIGLVLFITWLIIKF